jgi:hypothetical protein
MLSTQKVDEIRNLILSSINERSDANLCVTRLVGSSFVDEH